MHYERHTTTTVGWEPKTLPVSMAGLLRSVDLQLPIEKTARVIRLGESHPMQSLLNDYKNRAPVQVSPTIVKYLLPEGTKRALGFKFFGVRGATYELRKLLPSKRVIMKDEKVQIPLRIERYSETSYGPLGVRAIGKETIYEFEWEVKIPPGMKYKTHKIVGSSANPYLQVEFAQKV